MTTREEAIAYGLTFPNTYMETPFKDTNWQLIRVKESKKAFPEKDIKTMIAESYTLITDSPTKRIYEAVKRIPKGKVATYAQIAEMAGDRKMARAVGNALHKNPDPENIPCFRVVNSKGECSGSFAFGGLDEQAKRLREDGIEVVNNKVDLEKYGMKN